MNGIDRIVTYDVQGRPMGDIGPDEIRSRVRHEELNGEHALTIMTTRKLSVGTRLLTVDATGKWREWVVNEPDEEHASGKREVGTYRAPWSMQQDLSATSGGVQWASSEEGTNDPISATRALGIALTKSRMWQPGYCDIEDMHGASLFDGSCWDYLSQLVEVWGGEMDARIEVDSMGVVSRYVDWRARIGSETVTRRFDWSRDLTRMRRTPDPGPYFCRVVPRGGSEGTDSDGVKYSDRIGIESENAGMLWEVTEVPDSLPWAPSSFEELWDCGYWLTSLNVKVVDDGAQTPVESYVGLSVGDVVCDVSGVPWIQDDESAHAFRTRAPDGGWFFPDKTVTYSLDEKDDPEELLNKALDDLHNHTRPKVTYEADVMQLAAAGMDVQGVGLGDIVHCVDLGFGEDGLRIEGRVVGYEASGADERRVSLTIGQLGRTLADEVRSLIDAGTSDISNRITSISRGGSIVYLDSLLNAFNAEINATGGYFYAVQNQGVIVYDIAVDDPVIGYNSSMNTFANQVVQIKGGSIRISASKLEQFAYDEDNLARWNWRTVFRDGHIAVEAITTIDITAGRMHSADGSIDINLDNKYIHMGPGSTFAGENGDERTVQNVLDGVFLADSVRIATEWCVGESDDTPPLDGWSSVPTAADHLWERTRMVVTTKNRDTITYGSPSLAGTDGNTTDVTRLYNISTSDTEPDGEWISEQPVVGPGQHVWVRTDITDGNGTTEGQPHIVTELRDIWTMTAADAVADEADTRANEIAGVRGVLDQSVSDLNAAVREAAKTATAYIDIDQQTGAITIGDTVSAVKTVLTNAALQFVANGTIPAYIGARIESGQQSVEDLLWWLYIANAEITDQLRFGDFAWIARDNGNMTLKWVGA